MRLVDLGPTAALVLPHGTVRLDALNAHARTDWPTGLDALLDSGRFGAFHAWVRGSGDALATAPTAATATVA